MSNKKPRVQQSPYSLLKDRADDEVTLQIFDIIERNPRTSQRKITIQTGLAAGLVHSFMRRVISKGWIRAKQVNAKRWLYFITPAGFVEKSWLTMNYLSRTLQSYSKAQDSINNMLKICVENKWRRLVVAGENELAEIAALTIRGSKEFTLVAMVANERRGRTITEQKILPTEMIGELDYHKILVCDTGFLEWNKKKWEFLDKTKMLNLVSSVIKFE